MIEDKYRYLTEDECEEERRILEERAIHEARPTGALVDLGEGTSASAYMI